MSKYDGNCVINLRLSHQIFLYGKTNGVLLKAIELMFHTNENMSNLNRNVTYIMQNAQKVLNDVTFITTLVKYFCQCQKRMLEDEKQLQKGVHEIVPVRNIRYNLLFFFMQAFMRGVIQGQLHKSTM